MTQPQRIVDLNGGLAMVVTDLHGDWPLYERYRDVFLHLRARALAQTLVFAGDLIHSEGPSEEDRSLDILLDLIQLGKTLGPDLIVLLGNHEMPHIYHVTLAKGDQVYTPRFENAMGPHRQVVLRFLCQRPFFIRTAAGVTVCHAGAFPEALDPDSMTVLGALSHMELLDRVEAEIPPDQRPALRKAVGEISGIPYDALARTYLGVTDAADPRYDDYLLGVFAGYQRDFTLLWSALFSRNEYAEGMGAYTRQVQALLSTLSQDYAPQRMLVTGHIGARNGHRILAKGQHMRVASGIHAHPYRSARYLLFDAGKPMATAEGLLPGLGSVFER